MKTTLEAAAEKGTLTEREAVQFLRQHGLSYKDAATDLGTKVLDAVELCIWIGY